MKQKLLIILLLNFISFSSHSQGTLKISDIERSYETLIDFIEIYSDSTNTIDLNHIKSEAYSNKFIPVSDFNEKISNKNTYWLRFVIENYSLNPKVGLYIPLENHQVEVYTITDAIINESITGFFINGDENDEIIPLSNIIQIEGTGEIDIYIKIKNINDELPSFQLKLIDIEREVIKNKRKIIIDAIIQGMIWLMIIIGFLLFFLNRDKLYLYYSVYSFFLALWLAGTWGFYFQIFSGLPRNIYPYQSIPGFVGLLFYIQFIRSFINTATILPKWDRLLSIIQIITLIEIVRIPILISATNLVMLNYYIQSSVSLLLELFLLVFVIKVLLSGIKFKNIIGIGSSLLIICNFTGIFLWILYNDNISFIFSKVGAVLELIIFNFGLSYRYLLIEKEKQEYQAKLIMQLKENAVLQEKVNRELEERVQERTIEIMGKNEILEQQKNEIEIQKNNLTTSILYAQRIQSAVFPSDDILITNLPEHFILLKPLDIVSGDFYWFKQKNNFIYIVAADCTGHGVPGAFMSILGITVLNEIVSNDDTNSANEVLTQLRNNVIKTLHQSHENTNTRDGIEMALCIFDLENQKLQFSGAFRPMYLIRDDQLFDITGDKMPIGIYDNEESSFSNTEMILKNNDIVYLFSDGYVDQIGGSDRKTFKTKRFKELLLDICKMPMNEQKQMLERKIEEWRGDLEQVDDILVIGIRLNV